MITFLTHKNQLAKLSFNTPCFYWTNEAYDFGNEYAVDNDFDKYNSAEVAVV